MSIKWVFPRSNERAAYVFSFLAERLGLNSPIPVEMESVQSGDTVIAWSSLSGIREVPADAHVVLLHNSHNINRLERVENHSTSMQIGQTSIPVLSTKARAPKEFWKKGANASGLRHKTRNWYFIPIDIPVNIFYHLSRFEERSRHFSDEQPADHQKSLLWHNGRLLTPVVDVLIREFSNVFTECMERAGVPLVALWPWPGGEPWGAALTHDVDLTRGLSLVNHGKELGKNILVRLAGKMEQAEQQASETHEKSLRLWTFTDLRALYQKYGISATFFFLAKTLEGLHLRYYTGSDRFRKLFTQLKVDCHEIGLHPSLNAFDNPESYSRQRNRLSRHATTTINGMRQHYLRCRFPRLWKLADIADMKYDSSLGYNYAAGFRAGTVFPIAAFDVTANCQRRVIEFPLMFFENSLADGEAEDKIDTIIGEVEKHHGLLTALLHPSSYADEKWKIIWQELTARIAKSGAWTGALETHLKWLKDRSKIQIYWKKDAKDSWVISINKPDHIFRFALQIPAHKELTAITKVKLSVTESGIVVVSGKQKKIQLRLQ